MLGAIVLASTYVTVPLDFVLAVNRVFVIAEKCSTFERYMIYDVRNRTLQKSHVIQVLTAVSWLAGIVALGLFLSPDCRMAFINYTWDSRYCQEGRLVPLLEFIVLDPLMVGTFVAYLVIVGMIVAQVRQRPGFKLCLFFI